MNGYIKLQLTTGEIIWQFVQNGIVSGYYSLTGEFLYSVIPTGIGSIVIDKIVYEAI